MTHAVPPLRPGHHLQLLEGSRAFFPSLVAAIDGPGGRSCWKPTSSTSPAAGPTWPTHWNGRAGAGSPCGWWSTASARRSCRRSGRCVSTRRACSGRCIRARGAFGLLWPGQWRRLHRKLCVVDETIGFCGGINILDDYHDPNHGPLLSPRLDFSLRVEGPLVQQMHQTMQRQWSRIEAMGQLKRARWSGAFELWRAARPQPARAAALPRQGDSNVRAALLLRDNLRNRAVIERSYLRAIGRARDEIIIANAYFVPGGRMRRALINAARRGVHVNLLVQGRYEYFMQYYASRPVFGALLRAGVHIHEYAPSFLHAKVAVIDGRWATVGSSNLDPLSLLLAREANVVVDDPRFARRLRERLLHAMVQEGKRMDPAAYEKRPPWQRVKERLALVVMRILLVIQGKKYL
jgi:cardiolipin synthase